MRRRLDAELVRRGLSRSRSEAANAVEAGLVTVAGRPAGKPSTLVGMDEPLHVEGPPRRFVSRGGAKLAAALHRFGVDPAGLDCLDAGASTGGFTDCLLQRGAARVVAVDVGYGELAWQLRRDPRVVLLERTNVRDLQPDMLSFAPGLVTADLSFISLRIALPALSRAAGAEAGFVLLVKPQFEAGRADVGKGGVVRDLDVWQRVLTEVSAAATERGLQPVDVMPSPLLGPAGNVEFFLHATRGAARTGPLAEEGIEAAVREAIALKPVRATP